MASAVGSATSSIHLQAFDKGVRSRVLAEQLATVVNTSSLVKENPFPMFVNTLVVRLAEVFRDGNNEIRQCVARVLSECSSHLSLVFSGEEIVKRLLTVSHSNDANARALTLQVLASIAPVCPENKQVHHLIIESLSTSHNLEFKSACHAMTSFSTLSSQFSATIMEQLGGLLISPTTSLERKTLLVSVFSSMRATLSTTKEVFLLANSLLETCTQNDLIISLLNSMTLLAVATRYAIPDQLLVLLNVIDRCEENAPLAVSTLQNLSRLANHSHVWQDEHLNLMMKVRSKLEHNEPVFVFYVRVLIQLSKKVRPNHLSFFNDVLSEIGYLSCSQNVSLRVSFLEMSNNIYRNHPNESLCVQLVNAFICTIKLQLPTKLSRRLYRLVGEFLCFPSVSSDSIAAVIDCLISLPLFSISIPSQLELFCLLAERLPVHISSIHSYAEHIAKSRPDLYHSTLSYLLLSPSIPTASSSVLLLRPRNNSDRYSYARVAFRNGHWRTAALPLLQQIQTNCLSWQCARWIEVLRELASSQLEELTLLALQKQNRHLMTASITMKNIGSASSSSNSFMFPSRLIDTLLESSDGLLHTFSSLSVFIHLSHQFALPSTSQRIANTMHSSSVMMSRVVSSWSDLFRLSFDADPQSIDFLSLQHSLYSIILYGLQLLAAKGNTTTVMIPQLSVETTVSLQTRSILIWANSQMAQLARSSDTPITSLSLSHFISVLKALIIHPMYLPRFFFQQSYSTKIKLSVNSSNGELSELAVNSNQLVAIRVDGNIISTHPIKLQTIIITASVYNHDRTSISYSQKQEVQPTEDSYFTVQFLMQFRQSCSVEFNVNFIDCETRKKWTSDAMTSLRIITNE